MDARILELLTTESGDQSVEQLSRILHGMIDSSEVSPQHLQDLGWEMRCRVQLSWPSHGPLGSYRAIFQRQVEKRTVERREIPQVTAGLSQNWHKWNRYANKPLREVAEKDQVTQWREYLSGRLPDYMTPTAYVMLDALPLTPNGKLDRKALPAPDMRKAEGRNGYPAPETPLEQIVVGIFEEVLKLDRVGRKDNFFELGGHSLLATQVISRVRKMSGVDLGVRSVFEKPTAEDLSRKIEESLRAGRRMRRRRWSEYPESRDCRCRSRSRDCGSSTSWIPAAPSTTFREP